MKFSCTLTSFLLIIKTSGLSSSQSEAGLTPISNVMMDLSGAYILSWHMTDNDTMEFKVEVRTHGFIGFGLSPNGGMRGADILIGWVKNGKAYLSDSHGIGNQAPVRDVKQDWNLISGFENSTHTVLRFTRKIDTCDEQDRPITSDTMRVLWAYHSTEDADFSPDGSRLLLSYHGQRTRGSRSLYLLKGPEPPNNPDEQKFTFDILNPNVHVPDSSTTYWCQSFKLPSLKDKHHIIEISPIVQAGHERLVHHIIVYKCYIQLQEKHINFGHRCYHPNMPDEFNKCTTVFLAWAIGGQNFSFPVHAGMPIGGETDPVYVWMETHYDNQERRNDLYDSSGVRFTYTPNLRQYDAGVMQTGHVVSVKHIIPPRQPRFTSYGYCVGECLTEAMKEGNQMGGINVFGIIQHSHLLGDSLHTRHFRNGVELPPIVRDESYDFNYQDFRLLPHEVKILPGDTVITECVYKSTDRASVSWGGLSTREEMCLTFLVYYPYIPLGNCESRPTFANVLSITDIKEVNIKKHPAVVTQPASLRGKSWLDVIANHVNWSDPAVVARYQQIVRRGDVVTKCQLGGKHHYSMDWAPYRVATLTTELGPRPSTCNSVKPQAKPELKISKGTESTQPRRSNKRHNSDRLVMYNARSRGSTPFYTPLFLISSAQTLFLFRNLFFT